MYLVVNTNLREAVRNMVFELYRVYQNTPVQNTKEIHIRLAGELPQFRAGSTLGDLIVDIAVYLDDMQPDLLEVVHSAFLTVF